MTFKMLTIIDKKDAWLLFKILYVSVCVGGGGKEVRKSGGILSQRKLFQYFPKALGNRLYHLAPTEMVTLIHTTVHIFS